MPKRNIQSDFLSDRQVKEIIAAINFANKSGIIFNRWITINLEQCRVGIDDRFTTLQKFLGFLRREKGVDEDQFTAVWVREIAGGVGEHVHILAHFPPKVCDTYQRKYRGWLKSAGIQFVLGGINTKTIWNSVSADINCKDFRALNIEHLKSYLLKGAHQETLKKYGLRRKRFSGPINGKRCGTTQNLGPAVRKRNGKGQ